MNDDDKVGSHSVKCGHVTQETDVATDIPATIDEIRDEHLSASSQRWLWNPWTWFGGLAGVIVLVALLETYQLGQEVRVAHLLHQRGCMAIYADGWLRRLLPKKWRPSNRIAGDRIVQLYFPLQSRDLKPIDDLIPELRKLSSLRAVHFDEPLGVFQIGTDPKSWIATHDFVHQEMTILEQVGGVKEIYLSGLRESGLTHDLVQSLRPFEVEHIMLWGCQYNEADMFHFKTLKHLKRLSLIGCEKCPNAVREFGEARPDVAVTQAPF